MRRGLALRRSGDGRLEIEGYTDLVEIGSGTSATVYRAFQAAFQRQVALKILTAENRDERAQRRFISERAMTGRLSRHPNVITVYDSGFAAGRRPYLAMEYFARGSYADVVNHSGPLSVDDVLRVGIKIAGALESAHRAGVIHRDLKPQNILLSGYDEPVLADFGLAIAADPEASFTAGLTPAHAAPELLEGSPPSVATDIYALGSTLYALIAGRPPFAGPTGEGLLAQFHRIALGAVPDIPRADLPPSVMLLLRRALATAPAERFRTAADLGRALQAEQRVLGLAVTDLVLEAETVRAPTSTSIVDTRAGEETATRAAAFAPTPQPGVTGSAAPEVATLAGRLPSPPPAEARPARNTRRPVIVAGVAIGLVLAGAGVAVSRVIGSGGATATRQSPPSALPSVIAEPSPSVDITAVVAPPPSTAPAVALDSSAPTDVTTQADGPGLVRLSWRDHTGGSAAYLIYASEGGAYLRNREVDRGLTSAVVTVTADSPTCLKVIAVISIGRTPASVPVCINGGVAPTAMPSS